MYTFKWGNSGKTALKIATITCAEHELEVHGDTILARNGALNLQKFPENFSERFQ
jgi:hypothetical protein